MSRASSLFTVGIFILFLAILFHYFCRTRKKPELIVQQQVMPGPEGYVYPITPNNVNVGHHLNLGGQNPNHPQLYPAMPLPYPVTPGQQYGYSYSPPNNVGGVGGGAQNAWPTGYPHSPPSLPNQNNQSQSHPHPAHPTQQSMEDLPPPYHIAVGAGAGPAVPQHSHHPQQ